MAKKKQSSFRGKVASDTKRQQSANNFGYLKLPRGLNVYAPTPGGKEKIDIIPYIVKETNHPDMDKEMGIAIKGSLWYKRPFRTHRGVGADNDTVVCLTSFGKKCPICEYRKKQALAGATKEELQQFNSSQRNLYIVIPKGIKKVEEIPHIFDMSQYLFQNLLNQEIDENEDFEVFPDLEEGKTLQIRWTEESFAGNKYAEAGRIDFLDRDEAYDESILEDLPELGSLLKELTYDELHAKFFEIDHEQQEEEEEDDEAPKSKKKPIKKSKPVEEDDSDAENELPFKDDEEEEEEKPKKSFQKPSTKSPASTAKKVKPEPEPEGEEEETSLTWEELVDMDNLELIDVISEMSIDIDPDDYDEEEDLRKAIAQELEIEIPKAKPAKKETPKTAKPAKQVEDTATGKGKCPHGFKFGIDTDTKDECDDCAVWAKCIDKKEGK